MLRMDDREGRIYSLDKMLHRRSFKSKIVPHSTIFGTF